MKVITLHTESRIIRKAMQNDRKAQQKLFDSYAPKMLGVCRRYIADHYQAEEVMLNGFLKVFTHLNSFKNEGSFEGWIRKIMVRESLSELRKHKKIQWVEADENLRDKEAELHLDTWAVEAIQNLIDRLPPGYKMIFVLNEIEGYKHQEIAEMLSISQNTSKTQLRKAKKMLQNFVNASKEIRYESKKQQ